MGLLESLQDLNELCPSCGEFVDELIEETGFCRECSGVGDSSESPTLNGKAKRRELWLRENADIIEGVMLDAQTTAKDAIIRLAVNEVSRCECCGEEMPHTTVGRHFFCSKHEKCRKARRYYKYLVYEKNVKKEEARKTAIERFSND